MKRIALLTVLLLALGLVTVSADDVLKPALAISGGATLSWGVDLDSGYTGFANANDIDIVLTLITAFGNTKSGEGAVYGKITISNVAYVLDGESLALDDVWDGTLDALIVAGPVTFDIYSAPDISLGQSTLVEGDDTGSDSAYPIVDSDSRPAASPYDGNGFTASMAFAPVTLTATALSNGDWTANTANAYAFGLGASIALKPMTIGLGGGYGFGYATNDPIAYVTFGLDTDMFDAAVAFDLLLAATAAYDASVVLTLTPVADTTVVATVYYGSDSNLDTSVIFTEPAAKGLVPNLGATVEFFLLDLMATAEYELDATVSYAIGDITPSVTVKYGSEAGDVASEGEVADTLLEAVVAVSAAVIPNTTLSATWTSGDLLTPNAGTDAAWPSGQYGTFVLAAKVSF